MRGEPWLPETALTAPGVPAELLRACDDWSQQWLARTMLIAPNALRPARQLPMDLAGFSEVASSGAFRLRVAPEARLMLASAIFDRQLSARDLRRARDRAILTGVAEEALDKLAESVADLARLSGVMPDLGIGHSHPYGLPLHFGDLVTHLIIDVSSAFAVALARKAAGPARPSPKPRKVAAAVARNQVSLRAVVGRQKLPMAEVAGMGLGDVVTLGTPLGQTLDLQIGLGVHIGNAASLAVENSQLIMKIERPAAQWQTL